MIELVTVGFFTSLFINFFIILCSEKIKCFHDSNNGPQKNHSHTVPRVGGIGLFLGFVFSFIFLKDKNFYFLLSILPVFSMGLLEDISKIVSARMRLAASFLSAIFAMFFLNAILTRVGIPLIDKLFEYDFVCILVTLIAISGVVNAINIIDGFNGLASIISVIILMGLSYVAFKVNDMMIVSLCFIIISCIFGFFIWNYPFGKIFLGDGGAYFLGFSISVLSLMLVNRHKEVSPWFPLLLCIYPVFETLFTIYRRKIFKRAHPMRPDRLHLHTLLYRRVVPQLFNTRRDMKLINNSATSPFCWLLCTMGAFPALIFWNNTPMLIISIILFCFFYVSFYKKIINFSLFSKKNFFFIKKDRLNFLFKNNRIK